MNFQEILNTVKDQITQSGGELPAGVDINQVASVASETVMSGFSKQAGSGDFSGILEMFSGSETQNDNPVMAGISPDLIQQLSSKLGIDSATAAGISNKILPIIMNAFNSKAGANGFDIQGIIGQFKNGGIGNLIDGFMSDKSSNQKASNGGGIFNLIKGLFGK